MPQRCFRVLFDFPRHRARRLQSAAPAVPVSPVCSIRQRQPRDGTWAASPHCPALHKRTCLQRPQRLRDCSDPSAASQRHKPCASPLAAWLEPQLGHQGHRAHQAPTGRPRATQGRTRQVPGCLPRTGESGGERPPKGQNLSAPTPRCGGLWSVVCP